MRHLSLAAALTTAVLVAACNGADPPAAGTTTTGPAGTTTTTAAPTTTAPVDDTTTTGAPDVQVIEIGLEGGVPVGGPGRERVALGSTVAIRVMGDVEDEVHVHGYDLFADLEPGGMAVIEFVADIPGVFEVELESTHVKLLDLEVS